MRQIHENLNSRWPVVQHRRAENHLEIQNRYRNRHFLRFCLRWLWRDRKSDFRRRAKPLGAKIVLQINPYGLQYAPFRWLRRFRENQTVFLLKVVNLANHFSYHGAHGAGFCQQSYPEWHQLSAFEACRLQASSNFGW